MTDALLVTVIVLVMALVAVVAIVLLRDSRERAQATDNPSPLTRRMRLPAGQWAEVRTRVTQGMGDALISQVPEGATPDDLNDAVASSMVQALIVAGVSRWSFGSVDLDTLVTDVPMEDQEAIGAELVKTVQRSAWWKQVEQAGAEALRG